MTYKRFYSELGKLLYAIADSNGIISRKERDTLLAIVKKELVPAEMHTDEYGTDTAYYTGIEFDFLDEEIADTEAAFNSFIDYLEEHHTAFDNKMLQVCMRVAKELAASYHRVNKKEKALLTKLERVVDKIEKENQMKALHKKTAL